MRLTKSSPDTSPITTILPPERTEINGTGTAAQNCGTQQDVLLAFSTVTLTIESRGTIVVDAPVVPQHPPSSA
eukprot:CAMPEP_0171963914 /NCGR_PEP_ID=MMETSP0993-20121228/178577_1 /TAXON_ID=483369 /ORGANISM="non described non described, Strain CCMP2098" /LENGTH=72 /DNA_ID=CAMNT_0012612631 /DNA_START=187 /DNA_END=402 /DNA_ORIENTATION=-